MASLSSLENILFTTYDDEEEDYSSQGYLQAPISRRGSRRSSRYSRWDIQRLTAESRDGLANWTDTVLHRINEMIESFQRLRKKSTIPIWLWNLLCCAQAINIQCIVMSQVDTFQHRAFPFRINGSQWRERGKRQAGRESGAQRRPGEQLQLRGLRGAGAGCGVQAPGRESRQQTARHRPGRRGGPVILPQLTAAWTVIN